jgi:hypothetical protein
MSNEVDEETAKKLFEWFYENVKVIIDAFYKWFIAFCEFLNAVAEYLKKEKSSRS